MTVAKKWKKKLARDWHGGSEARLKKEVRRSLHVQYDEIYETAKIIKRDHDAALLRFDKAHRRSGYKPAQWQEFWVKYASELYEYDPAFVSLFTNQDNPSASEVAYRQLSADTGQRCWKIETSQKADNQSGFFHILCEPQNGRDVY